eukprot:CAMPEP_0174292556 /NCGR_PEP_ID=MMETSP0809-20121228/35849_1 /TAXON_ID=73025 ORGANISM="Eutreptiella gymnastica-like, Strain CCMP1594" /NCGR_SAMPLE_ID=MMETSP0809 /ASSEMBLY_ACC=CAM_ASM_000658 /LENGTH=59 /DNA_ID=CAMNT_0015392707 /DNA_START=164 /DNA_END=339 /DNA_ORIENTATION=+
MQSSGFSDGVGVKGGYSWSRSVTMCGLCVRVAINTGAIVSKGGSRFYGQRGVVAAGRGG